jgi:hypothetical protein
MNKNSLAIATISLARTMEEERTLRASLQALAELQLPLFITDGGSSAAFVSFLQNLPEATVFAERGLWPQARKSITEAAASGATTIFYTEPDKEDFFRHHLAGMLAASEMTNRAGVLLASRSSAGFATFPAFQQMTEQTINKCCEEVIGLSADYCYGPFLFNGRLVQALNFLPENCGWGWRPALFAVAHRGGLTVDAYTGHFACPPAQREDNETERLYRMKQLSQNIDGLVMAAKDEAVKVQ